MGVRESPRGCFVALLLSSFGAAGTAALQSGESYASDACLLQAFVGAEAEASADPSALLQSASADPSALLQSAEAEVGGHRDSVEGWRSFGERSDRSDGEFFDHFTGLRSDRLAILSDSEDRSVTNLARRELLNRARQERSSHTAHDRSRYGWKSVHGVREHPPLKSAGQGYRQVMTNKADTQYLSYLQVGGQMLASILDTGSFELVVFSKDCFSCGQAAKYDPILSTTHKAGKLFSGQSYGSGQTWSRDASDKIDIGPYKKVNQTFWEVVKAKMPVLGDSDFQAILGLGPPETPAMDAWEAAQKAAKNITDTLVTTGKVDMDLVKTAEQQAGIAAAMVERTTFLNTVNASMFSVCIGKEPQSDGVFVWNDTSVILYPELFQRVPVLGKHTWSVEARNARLSYVSKMKEQREQETPGHGADEEGNAFDANMSISLGCEDGCGVLVDSGTSLLALPGHVIASLVKLMQAQDFNCSNMWELPHIVFEMGGHTFSLPPDTYVAEVEMPVPSYMQSFVRVRNLGKIAQRPGNRCDLVAMESMASTELGRLWVFGMPFFRKYYTTFSLGSSKNGSDRAIYFAGASPSCTPIKRSVEVHDGPPDMWKRYIDPTQLWMPASVVLAAREAFVML